MLGVQNVSGHPRAAGVDDRANAALCAQIDALERTVRGLRFALEAGKLGVWELDLATRRLTASPRCKANHGFAADADMQLETEILPAIDDAHRDRFIATIESAIASGEPFEIEVPQRFPDGSAHSLFVAGRVIDTSRMVGVSLDTTERRCTEEALRDADRQKDEFLAVLSHELRSPLAPILTAVTLLELTGPPDPSLAQMRATIKRQTVHLTRIVDDLLDAGRIRSGKLDIEKTPGELNDIVRLALETSTPLMEQRRHRLNVTYAPAPIHFEVDAQRIVQVVCNLLNNAAKYSPRGSTIDVAVTVEQNDAVIHVRDSGIGIPPHMLERIFERFVQVKTGLRQAGGGLGIGLSLVRALVDLHGGTVTAESEGSGKGSLFTVRLPLRPGV